MQRVQISGEGSALSFLPHSELHFHIPFLCWRMWHISISLFSLIRICWLNINEINPSWWHWIRLLFEYACICSAHWLHGVDLTPSSAQMFQLPVCFLVCHKWVLFCTKAENSVLNYLSVLSLPLFMPWGYVCYWHLLVGVWNAPHFPPPSPSLYPSCRQWVLIEAWLSDDL